MISEPADSEPLGFCLYRSVARPGLAEHELQAILEHSRTRNRSRGLTGCLHHEDNTFFQWVEGPRLAVYRLVETLWGDDRHIQMKVLDQGPLEQRYFPNWQMRFSDRASASLMDWLASADKMTFDPEHYAVGIRAFLTSLQK